MPRKIKRKKVVKISGKAGRSKGSNLGPAKNSPKGAGAAGGMPKKSGKATGLVKKVSEARAKVKATKSVKQIYKDASNKKAASSFDKALKLKKNKNKKPRKPR